MVFMRPSYLYNENPVLVRRHIYIETALWRKLLPISECLFNFIWAKYEIRGTIVSLCSIKYQWLYGHLFTKKRRRTGTGIPIINLRRPDDRFRFIMWILKPIRRCLFSDWRPRYCIMYTTYYIYILLLVHLVYWYSQVLSRSGCVYEVLISRLFSKQK